MPERRAPLRQCMHEARHGCLDDVRRCCNACLHEARHGCLDDARSHRLHDARLPTVGAVRAELLQGGDVLGGVHSGDRSALSGREAAQLHELHRRKGATDGGGGEEGRWMAWTGAAGWAEVCNGAAGWDASRSSSLVL